MFDTECVPAAAKGAQLQPRVLREREQQHLNAAFGQRATDEGGRGGVVRVHEGGGQDAPQQRTRRRQPQIGWPAEAETQGLCKEGWAG